MSFNLIYSALKFKESSLAKLNPTNEAATLPSYPYNTSLLIINHITN